jgi:prepilin-type N-terminal cleavage/methylation domain-containing protein
VVLPYIYKKDIDRGKEMKDKITKKNGFTMAELLIVVAIIAVLVAVAIPIFNKQLEKSREAYDIATMRQAASLATEFYYAGVVDKPTAEANGLQWWNNNNVNQNNAAGVYDPSTGKFLAIRSTEGKAYGKGTSTSSGKTYTFNDDRKIYKPDADYTNAVCMVSIYPTGNNKHIDVYWKNTKDGKYIGLDNGANNPKYSIRINLN